MELNFTEFFQNMGMDVNPVDGSLDGAPEMYGAMTFLKSMDWSEPWLYCLIGFYVLLSLFIYGSRHSTFIQSFTFIFLLLTVYIAEDLNEYLSKNYKAFTRHQYFDSSGLFISLFMSLPLLLASAFIVGNWFHQSTVLMTQMKQLQVNRSRRQINTTEESKKTKWT